MAMEFLTEDEQRYPGYKHLMWCAREEDFIQSVTVERYRVLLVREGSGIIRIGQRSYPIMAPAIYCLNEKEEVSLQSDMGCVASTIYFHPRMMNHKFGDLEALSEHSNELFTTDYQDLWLLDPFIIRNDNYYGCISIDLSFAKWVGTMINDVCELLAIRGDQHWPCRSRSLLLEILFPIRRLFANPIVNDVNQVPNVDSEIVESVIHYLYMNYKSKVKLEDISKQFMTNKTTLNQHFKAATGSSIIAYLSHIRMQMASSLLRNTKLPTNDIMLAIGFTDSSHFIRTFKRYAGHSPSDYRKQFCWVH
jgi:AraC-like DNA-binding protein